MDVAVGARRLVPKWGFEPRPIQPESRAMLCPHTSPRCGDGPVTARRVAFCQFLHCGPAPHGPPTAADKAPDTLNAAPPLEIETVAQRPTVLVRCRAIGSCTKRNHCSHDGANCTYCGLQLDECPRLSHSERVYKKIICIAIAAVRMSVCLCL